MKHVLLPSLPVLLPHWRSAVTRLASTPRQLGIRLFIWFPGLVMRATSTYWFREIVLRPVSIALMCYVVLLVTFKLSKTGTIETGDLRVAVMLEDLKARWNTRVSGGDHSDRNRGVGQSMTWGLAGAAVVLLTTIVAYHLSGPPIRIAASCFSLAAPVLILFGILSALQTDPQHRPTVKAMVLVQVPILLAQLIFCFGFAAFLWSYDPLVATIFAMGCGLALRLFQKLSIDHFASQSIDPGVKSGPDSTIRAATEG